MTEPRKNHLNIDGAQVKDEENVASYKPIPESDQEFRPPSKASLSKSKERVSDPAEEKLLTKEDEARIVTRVDMTDADAKYVVGDHRNGDAKIELDANKRQFSGLTKEELLKYADDPFWVRLRWFMFVLFWTLWLCMLAGAIAIIIRAPKCAPPPPKTWYEVGPLADRTSEEAVDYSELQEELPLLARSKVQGVFINPCADTYQILDDDTCLDQFTAFLETAKQKSVKVIVDLTANFVSTSHAWFLASENSTSEFADYFVWGAGKDSDPDGTKPQLPNNWVSRYGGEAWSWSEKRRAYYLHQYHVHQADLNFHNNAVVARFDQVLNKWMAAGAAGVRLLKARQLLVNKALPDEHIAKEKTSLDSSLKDYMFLRHKETSDQPELDALLAHWAHIVTQNGQDKVFTIHEDGVLQPEWYRLRNSSVLRPPCAAPVALAAQPADQLARDLDQRAHNWTALQLTASDEDANTELVALAMLLPVTPVLQPGQLPRGNESLPSESFAHLAALRDDDSIKFGERRVEPVPVSNSTEQMIICARWKAGHTGYVAVFNPGETARANLTGVTSLPESLTVHHVSHAVRVATNYTSNSAVQADSVLVPGGSSVVLSYVPKTTAEQ